MTRDPSAATKKPCLDDLLATMGITREQLTNMTADDLFAAATRWQDEATLAAEGKHSLSPTDRFLEGLRGPPADIARLN
jgi:hypothetical protein